MELIQGTTEFELKGSFAAAIGKFDGIHRGHQALLQKIIDQKSQKLRTAVFTFDPPPAVFFGSSPYQGLTTRAEKRRIFEKLGIDVLIEFPMNETTAAMEPEEFIQKVLVEKMHVACVAAGTDLSFGSKGRGDSSLLAEYGDRNGFHVEVIDKICVNGEEVSSSLIRDHLEAGHMDKVRQMIGFPYSVTGKVIHGKKLGRTLGMPTVNIQPEADKLLPPKGVYASYVSYGGRHYRSISNIGCKPTVSSESVLGVESYLYDFAEEIYGQWITVNLLEFMRPEMRFASVEQLKAQMEKDILAGSGK